MEKSPSSGSSPRSQIVDWARKRTMWFKKILTYISGVGCDLEKIQSVYKYLNHRWSKTGITTLSYPLQNFKVREVYQNISLSLRGIELQSFVGILRYILFFSNIIDVYWQSELHTYIESLCELCLKLEDVSSFLDR